MERARFLRDFGVRHPVLAEFGRVRHYHRSGYASEHLADLAGLWRERATLAARRARSDVCWVEGDTEEPLVTIRIATRDRPELLVARSVRMALQQSYERVEVLVVGDSCDDRTHEALRRVRDPRLRYVNLSRAGSYPPAGVDRWRVAGSKPMNVGVQLAGGSWIAPCDDDDEFTEDHVESLLTFCKANRLEFAWSKTAADPETPRERVLGSAVPRRGSVTHGSVLYSVGLDFMAYSATCYRVLESSDVNLWKRMLAIGVRMGFLDRVTYRYWPAEGPP